MTNVEPSFREIRPEHDSVGVRHFMAAQARGATREERCSGLEAMELRLTRGEFEGACSSLLERSLRPVRDVLDGVGIKPEEVDEVVLVGPSGHKISHHGNTVRIKSTRLKNNTTPHYKRMKRQFVLVAQVIQPSFNPNMFWSHRWAGARESLPSAAPWRSTLGSR